MHNTWFKQFLSGWRFAAEEILYLHHTIVEEEIVRIHIPMDDLLMMQCFESPKLSYTTT